MTHNDILIEIRPVMSQSHKAFKASKAITGQGILLINYFLKQRRYGIAALKHMEVQRESRGTMHVCAVAIASEHSVAPRHYQESESLT